MSLISLKFILFMAILLILYYRVPERFQWQVLLWGSLCFYAFAGPHFLIFLGISILSTFFLMRNPTKPRLLLVFAISLGLLIFFRYSFYFGMKSIAVPLGISFYTFMTLGYALDCYDKKITPCESLPRYALFISYFPQITQGPIGTYKAMSKELSARHPFDPESIKAGGYRVLIGWFKKLVIAGRLSFYVDTVFSNPEGYGGLTLITATFFYAFELYADFSGYMDIACGISQMLGIKLSENFNRPYFSRNIPEYWRRWHITLNEWFSAHLFMPAVTSKWNKKAANGMHKLFPFAKKGTLRMILPLILVWITTGIWHGAEAVYIGWGVYFAIIMLLSFCTQSMVRSFSEKIGWNPEHPLARIFQVVRTFLIVCTGEVMFRAESMKDAFSIYRSIFTKTRLNAASIAEALVPFGNGNQAAASVLILSALLFGLFFVEFRKEQDPKAFTRHRYLYAGVFLVLTALLGSPGQSSFMYQSF